MRGPTRNPGLVARQFLSAHPLPYDRKPGPFGAILSIYAKRVSRDVHNIAFSLEHDHFHTIGFAFFAFEGPTRVMKALLCQRRVSSRFATSETKALPLCPKPMVAMYVCET